MQGAGHGAELQPTQAGRRLQQPPEQLDRDPVAAARAGAVLVDVLPDVAGEGQQVVVVLEPPLEPRPRHFDAAQGRPRGAVGDDDPQVAGVGVGVGEAAELQAEPLERRGALAEERRQARGVRGFLQRQSQRPAMTTHTKISIKTNSNAIFEEKK
jgi:hypothetical protein